LTGGLEGFREKITVREVPTGAGWHGGKKALLFEIKRRSFGWVGWKSHQLGRKKGCERGSTWGRRGSYVWQGGPKGGKSWGGGPLQSGLTSKGRLGKGSVNGKKNYQSKGFGAIKTEGGVHRVGLRLGPKFVKCWGFPGYKGRVGKGASPEKKEFSWQNRAVGLGKNQPLLGKGAQR